MEAARTTEVLITATSPNSIEDAVNEAVARAATTLRGAQDVQVREQRVLYEGGSIVGYRVALVATFALEDDGESAGDLGVVLEPSEYRRLREAEEELEDLRAYEEAIMELRTGEDQLIPWQEAKPRIEAERNALRRRGQL